MFFCSGPPPTTKKSTPPGPSIFLTNSEDVKLKKLKALMKGKGAKAELPMFFFFFGGVLRCMYLKCVCFLFFLKCASIKRTFFWGLDSLT